MSLSADGDTAWIDEMLDTPNFGACRGSVELVRERREWKIAQYNLSAPMPNSIMYTLVEVASSD